MLGISSFNRSVDVLHRSMNVAWMRQDVLANNVANSETPNFKRSDINYESFVKRAIASEKEPVFAEKLTRKNHLAIHEPTDYRTIKPRIVTDYLSTTKNNGNNVDIESETTMLLKNQMSYELMSQAINHQFKMIKTVYA